MSFLSLFPVVLLHPVVDNLSSNSLDGDESLDLGGFEESLVSSLDFSSDNVLSNVILLSKSECGSDGSNSLWTKSTWSFNIGESNNILFSLDENLKGNN